MVIILIDAQSLIKVEAFADHVAWSTHQVILISSNNEKQKDSKAHRNMLLNNIANTCTRKKEKHF